MFKEFSNLKLALLFIQAVVGGCSLLFLARAIRYTLKRANSDRFQYQDSDLQRKIIDSYSTAAMFAVAFAAAHFIYDYF